jgi:hypothetical protein
MTHKTSLTNALHIAAAAGLALFCQAGLTAQTMIGYLQQSPGHKLPVSPLVLPPQNCPAITFNPFTSVSLCVFGPFSLPGYAGTVYVGFSTVSRDVPEVSWQHNQDVELKGTSNLKYRWGADTDMISLYNPNAPNDPKGPTMSYTIQFYFKGPAPDPAALVLAVAGLKVGSTATVTGRTGSWPGTGAASLSTANGGEYTIPSTPAWNWCYPTCVSSSLTDFPTAPGAFTFSSGATWSTDERNTGWDLYQPNSAGLGVLSLNVTQLSGDGLGFTLGYKVCTTLVGNSLDSRTGTPHLYDINTGTGVATNSRPVGWNWDLAFSPLSPAGSLYALVQDFGTPTPDSLFAINASTGAVIGIPLTLPAGLVGMAADPTTGTFYVVDGAGNLTSLSSGPIGKIASSVAVSAMAFDLSGNLFVVDAFHNSLLKVAKSTANVIYSVPLTGYLSWAPAGAGLAIDPATGIAYYAQGGYIYTLNLATGLLTGAARLTGAEDNGYLKSMTFREGACPAPAPNPIPIL